MSTVTGQVKDGAKKGQEQVANAASQVSAKVSEVSDRVKDVSGRAANTVREQYGHLEHQAKDAYDRARRAGQEWEQGIESYVQRKPLVSLLIAAAVGMILGTVWKRR